ncbi:MAG: hypothetical protein AW07_02734 [Candidatus Accumulibacter sp. SK-11]|nr:MAG: hypothetical protein AW07_02734 [Candidatus Accumulibacter sp. SK-11]
MSLRNLECLLGIGHLVGPEAAGEECQAKCQSSEEQCGKRPDRATVRSRLVRRRLKAGLDREDSGLPLADHRVGTW